MKRLLIVAGFITACATPSPAVNLALASTSSVGTSVSCDSGCAIQWQRAQVWIAKHSLMKIQTATDVLIQTYNPIGHESQYAFNVTREPLAPGSYRISARVQCGNVLMRNPRMEDVRSALLYYVKTGTDVLEGLPDRGKSIQ